MIELKTLKDLTLGWVDYTPLGSIFVDVKKIREELKQEAIKWIKSCSKEGGEGDTIFTLIYVPNKGYISNIDDWIKHFFNLTEEDLK